MYHIHIINRSFITKYNNIEILSINNNFSIKIFSTLFKELYNEKILKNINQYSIFSILNYSTNYKLNSYPIKIYIYIPIF